MIARLHPELGECMHSYSSDATMHHSLRRDRPLIFTLLHQRKVSIEHICLNQRLEPYFQFRLLPGLVHQVRISLNIDADLREVDLHPDDRLQGPLLAELLEAMREHFVVRYLGTEPPGGVVICRAVGEVRIRDSGDVDYELFNELWEWKAVDAVSDPSEGIGVHYIPRELERHYRRPYGGTQFGYRAFSHS